jgi:hypothetical protein
MGYVISVNSPADMIRAAITTVVKKFKTNIPDKRRIVFGENNIFASLRLPL